MARSGISKQAIVGDGSGRNVGSPNNGLRYSDAKAIFSERNFFTKVDVVVVGEHIPSHRPLRLLGYREAASRHTAFVLSFDNIIMLFGILHRSCV